MRPFVSWGARVGWNWVQRQLGLNDDAFKMAVLLEQGKSDALLSAKPLERHALLSQLVDLSRYETLEKRAREGQNAAKITVQRNKLELITLPPVTDVEIATHEAVAAESKAQIEAAQQRLGQKLDAMRALIADAERIEAATLRLGDLQNVLPALRRILQHSENQVRHQREAAAHHQAAINFAAKVTEVTPLVEEAQRSVAQLQQERDDAQRA